MVKWKPVTVAALAIALLGSPVACQEPAQAGRSEDFKATVKVPIPGKHPAGKGLFELVGRCSLCFAGDPTCELKPTECSELVRTEILTGPDDWSGFEPAGLQVTQGVYTGMGYFVAPGTAYALGLTLGTMENGDTFLARWVENQWVEKVGDKEEHKTTGTWTLVFGTGELAGITGEAELACDPSKPEDVIETCTLTGSYSLPD